ncbi:dethiobiotin synthase [Propionibacterium freudenreichii]|nr:dethiobiotin synthase [Propionibacterium freudenreichii]
MSVPTMRLPASARRWRRSQRRRGSESRHDRPRHDRPEKGPPMTASGTLSEALRTTCVEGLTFVTGTDTDIGKTIVTAVLIRALLDADIAPITVKIAQTGLLPGEPGDVDDVATLSGLSRAHTRELSRCTEALAPMTAARREGVVLPTMAQVAEQLSELVKSQQGGPVVAEGSGGIMVGLDNQGEGLLDLVPLLAELGVQGRFIVVARAGLGTLNHAQMTCSAIRRHGGSPAGLVFGSYPADPDLAMLCNREEIADLCGTPLLGALPPDMGQLAPGAFAETARAL